MSPLDMPIHALPGFLGNADDWKLTLAGLKVTSHHLCETNEQYPFWEWAKHFNASVLGYGVLAGYSLGGRLALHAALLEPNRWKALIIVSAHPGLTDSIEKLERTERDKIWASRFLSDDWDSVMGDWNSQGVFASSFPAPTRNESYALRVASAAAMIEWSLGKQESLTERINTLQIPILWVVGEYDRKFLSVAQDITFADRSLNHSKKIIVPNAGHRVIFDAAELLNEHIKRFILNLEG